MAAAGCVTNIAWFTDTGIVGNDLTDGTAVAESVAVSQLVSIAVGHAFVGEGGPLARGTLT